MKCQALVGNGSGQGCSNEADFACVLTSWEDGGKRLYVCAEHQLPRETFHATYYVGRGATSSKVVPIEAARVRRERARARGED